MREQDIPPYWLQLEDNPYLITLPNTTFVVADCNNTKGESNDLLAEEEKLRNAKIVANAPAMLATLVELKYLLTRTDYDPWWGKALLVSTLREFDLITPEEIASLDKLTISEN